MQVAAVGRIKNDIGGLMAAFLIVAALYFAREVLIPLCLAGLITFLLAPFATWLERWRLPRAIAGILVIALMALTICSVGWIVLGQIYTLALELPQYQGNITHKVDALHLHSAGRLTTTVQMLSEIDRQIVNGTEHTTASSAAAPPAHRGKSPTAKVAPQNVLPASDTPVDVRIAEPSLSLAAMAALEIHPLIGPLTSAFAVVIFVIFMLLARDDIRDRTVRLMGSTRIHVTTVAMVDAATRVSRYLLMQFLVNLGYGVVVGFALWGIGIPHPLLWAVTTFLLRFVPYVGILAAGAGPVLMALAAAPNWSTAGWTLGLYILLELVCANAVEPTLYGSSTGVSALAILVAAIFWTWLWGIPGLLLSTPLTVCLIVVGQHVPRLEFLGVLFGEITVLNPPERLYQRVLASSSRDIRTLIDEEFKTNSREEVYDKVIIPTLSLVEDARHTEQLDSERAELALQQIEDAIDDRWNGADVKPQGGRGAIVCVAVKDLADDIACKLLKQIMSNTYDVETLAADLMSADVVETIQRVEPQAICVVGVPPRAIRHIRVRCHQLRTRFPQTTIVACVLSTECDLANVRGRIPMDDANHVVCSLQQAQEYLNTLALSSLPAQELAAAAPQMLSKFEDLPLDESSKEIFERITDALARAFEAPIAFIQIKGERNEIWEAQSGLPDNERTTASSLRHSAVFAGPASADGLLVPDTAEDARFREDPILREKGIRFVARTPVRGADDEAIGSLCVMDTRPRQIGQQQEEYLKQLAKHVSNAIALQRDLGSKLD